MKSRRQRGEGKGDTQRQEPGRQATTAEDHTPEKKALTEQKRTTRKVSPHFSSSEKELRRLSHPQWYMLHKVQRLNSQRQLLERVI